MNSLPESTTAATPLLGNMGNDDESASIAPPQRPVKISRVLLAGAGFFADAYDLFVINLVKELLKLEYPPDANSEALIASMALWGAVIGQLFFGVFADFVGRRRIFIITLVLITVGALGSAASVDTPAFSVYQQLAIWRFILGVGVGGEYPLSAAITSETATARTRGRLLATVFSMQGLGSLLSALVILICLEAGASNEFTWRFGLAFGAVPGLLAFYFRWRMTETESFHADVGKRRLTVGEHLRHSGRILKKYRRLVFGTAFAWFLLDIVFYGNALFSAAVLRIFGLGSEPLDLARNATYVALMSLPGYFLTIAFLDRVGRKRLQLVGFLVLGVLYIVLGAAYEPLQQQAWLFMILYGLTFLFSNFGPNATTYIIPGELFPTAIKATCHGISAAAGKVGAAVGGYAFAPLSDAIGLYVLAICGGVALLGAVSTFFFTPAYTAESLEELQQGYGMTELSDGDIARWDGPVAAVDGSNASSPQLP